MKKIVFYLVLIIATIDLSAQQRIQINLLHSEWNIAALQSKLTDNNNNDLDFRYQSAFKIWEKFDMSAWRFGPKISYFSKIRHLDADLYLPFTIDYYKVIDESNPDYTFAHRIYSFSPTLDFRYKIGDLRKDAFPTVTIGFSYDIPIMYRKTYEYYKGFYKEYFKYETPISKSLDNINSGFVFRIGIGLQIKEDRSIWGINPNKKDSNLSLMYSYKLYDLFNSEYTENNIKPYEGWTTSIGILSFTFSKYF